MRPFLNTVLIVRLERSMEEGKLFISKFTLVAKLISFLQTGTRKSVLGICFENGEDLVWIKVSACNDKVLSDPTTSSHFTCSSPCNGAFSLHDSEFVLIFGRSFPSVTSLLEAWLVLRSTSSFPLLSISPSLTPPSISMSFVGNWRFIST